MANQCINIKALTHSTPEALYVEGETKNIDPYGNDVWTLATMLIRMTTGEKFPNVKQGDILAIWQNDDSEKRAELIQKKWPSFTAEFSELLADIFCKQEKRMKMEQFKDDFKDVQIYC